MVREEDNLIFGIQKEFFVVGLIVSFSAHFILILLASLRIHNVVEEFKNNEPFVVYSVSIEGGKKLGGIAQVSKSGKKEQLVPYKKVEEQSAPAPKLETSEKAEVSIKDEAKQKEEAAKKAKAEKEAREAEIALKEKKAKAEKEKQAKIEAEKKAKAEAEKKAKAEAEAKAKAEAAKKEAARKEAERKAQEKKNAKPNGTVGGTGKGSNTANLDTKLQKALQRYIGESSDAGGVGFGAGKITGGNGMGGGIVRPPEFFKYKDILVKHIKSNWNWFDTSRPYKAQVEMLIDPKGNITKYSIVTSSGLERFDESLLRAIEKSSPLPAPPANVYEFFKDVRIVFDPKE